VANYTPNLHLKLPEQEELYNIDDMNINSQTLDAVIGAIAGMGGPLTAYNFGTLPSPMDLAAQQTVTLYAMEEIWLPGGTVTWETPIQDSTYEDTNNVVHLASDIFNGTWVVNLFDNTKIELTNTPGTTPPVFVWANVGYNTIAIASETVPGTVRAAGSTKVAANGDMTATSTIVDQAASTTLPSGTDLTDTAVLQALRDNNKSLDETKLSKQTGVTARAEVYGKDATGTQTMEALDSAATPSTIIKRDSAGKAQAATPAVTDPDTTIATIGFVDDVALPKSTTTPLEDGTAAIGSTDTYADGAHVHPHDTSKFDVPTGTTDQYIAGDGSLATFPNIVTKAYKSSGTTIEVGTLRPLASASLYVYDTTDGSTLPSSISGTGPYTLTSDSGDFPDTFGVDFS
jgi:hypothetical protein